MKKIRHGVFETNSSSTHSISIADENKPFVIDPIYPDENGVIVLHGEEFGWDWFKYNDAKTKATYAYQQLNGSETLINVLKDITGCEKIVFVEGWGYIDHDSVGIVENDYDYLKNFIFNKNSWLFGGNDNDDADMTFYDVPHYNENGVEEAVVYDRFVYINKVFAFKIRKGIDENEVEDMLLDYLEYKRLSSNGKVIEDYNSVIEFDSIDFKGQKIVFKTNLYWKFINELNAENMSNNQRITLARQMAEKEFSDNPQKYIFEIPYEIRTT